MHQTNNVCLANLLYGSDHAKYTQEGRLQAIKIKATETRKVCADKKLRLEKQWRQYPVV